MSSCVNVSQSFKDFFVFEMLTEFFKGVFNEPQNLNEHGHKTSLRFVSSLRLKQLPFHSQERRVCSIHTFYESSRRTATMIKFINLFIYTLYGIRRMSTQHQSRLYRGESHIFFHYNFHSFALNCAWSVKSMLSIGQFPIVHTLCKLKRQLAYAKTLYM